MTYLDLSPYLGRRWTIGPFETSEAAAAFVATLVAENVPEAVEAMPVVALANPEVRSWPT